MKNYFFIIQIFFFKYFKDFSSFDETITLEIFLDAIDASIEYLISSLPFNFHH